jgi:hypothetical protein
MHFIKSGDNMATSALWIKNQCKVEGSSVMAVGPVNSANVTPRKLIY